MVIYPLAEERDLLAQLPAWLTEEARTPGSTRALIIAGIRASEHHRRCGLFTLITNDILALLGEPQLGDHILVDSAEGARIPERSTKITHLLTRLAQYAQSRPQDEFRPCLYRGALARLEFAGQQLAVSELLTIPPDGNDCILCRSAQGDYFLSYDQPRAAWGERGIHRLTAAQIEDYLAGTLDIAALHRRVARA